MITLDAAAFQQQAALVPAVERLLDAEATELAVIRLRGRQSSIPASALAWIRAAPQILVGWLSGDCTGRAWQLAEQLDLCVAEPGTRVGHGSEQARVAECGREIRLVAPPEELTEWLSMWEEAARSRAVRLVAGLLRRDLHHDIDTGLFAESLLYATLQGGTEFETWLRTR